MEHCQSFSISGGVITDFLAITDEFERFRNILVVMGGNDLMGRERNPTNTTDEVLNRMKQLYGALRRLRLRQTVAFCSILKRFPDPQDCVQRMNDTMRQSDLPTYNITRNLTAPKFYNDDGVHLTLQGRKTLASHVREAMRHYNM